MDPRALIELLTEGVMFIVADRYDRRLGRFEAHVVPAKVLQSCAALGKALRAHGRARRTLAGK
jgi:hypothetical protein